MPSIAGMQRTNACGTPASEKQIPKSKVQNPDKTQNPNSS
jgi:hypothetical protein